MTIKASLADLRHNESIRLPFETMNHDGGNPLDDSAQTLVDKSAHLKPMQDEFLNYVHGTDSISQLSLNVNDSATDKTFDEVYEMGKVLGEGGFAFVYQCRHLHNHNTYAVKEVIKKDSTNGEEIRDEIFALKVVKESSHFVRLLDVFEEPTKTFLIMEEMKGGDLLDKLAEIEVYEEWEAKKVARTLMEAVHYCHKRKIAHRDIKPENILLPRADDITIIKLADFGCAKEWKESPNEMHTLCGSPQYVAPEVVGDTREEGEGYNFQCDLWSVGVVLYILLGGYAPFESEDSHELLDLICSADYEFHEEYWDDIEEKPKDLIRNLLEVDPGQRLTARQALRSPWLRRRDGDWVKEMDDSNSSSNSRLVLWLEKQKSRRFSLTPDSSAAATAAAADGKSAIDDSNNDSSTNWDQNEDSNRSLGNNWWNTGSAHEADEARSFADGPLSSGPGQDSSSAGFCLADSSAE